jgi:hypothetical protein
MGISTVSAAFDFPERYMDAREFIKTGQEKQYHPTRHNEG